MMITSIHNPKIQKVRALLNRRQDREEARAFVAEGVRLVEEAAAANWQVQQVLFCPEQLSLRGQQLVERCRQLGAEVEPVAPHIMQAATGTETPQGVLAVLELTPLPLPDRLNFVLVLDEVRDPGNLGTLLRSAAAAGVQAVLLTPGTTDAFSPKVVRSGMGAHFRLPIRASTWDEIRRVCHLQTPPLHLYLAEAEQGDSCWSLDMRQPLALLIGGEAEGASEAARSVADSNILIPMPGCSESLNAAVAGSILMFEVVRQRSA